MSWTTLQSNAKRMGYEVAFRSRWCDAEGGFMPDLTPPEGRNWIYVGCYDHIAAFWVKPLTANEQKLNGNLLRKMMADLDPFLGTVENVDVDFFESAAAIQLPLTTLGCAERRRDHNRERRRTSTVVQFDRRAANTPDRRSRQLSAWLS